MTDLTLSSLQPPYEAPFIFAGCPETAGVFFGPPAAAAADHPIPLRLLRGTKPPRAFVDAKHYKNGYIHPLNAIL
ncbi:hypothetical protein FBZ92_10377 [Nitrospirillum viridazoti]|uniref:Uncharacterized protein n=1 Tax=Nitrospirillum amazonense TaxID=28077 RepID=A0A560IXE8_9PROT|nr:hypothetical protein FBZ92_10377 [Nitrospirillum amazonense]